jgi:hypothetical protein
MEEVGNAWRRRDKWGDGSNQVEVLFCNRLEEVAYPEIHLYPRHAGVQLCICDGSRVDVYRDYIASGIRLRVYYGDGA